MRIPILLTLLVGLIITVGPAAANRDKLTPQTIEINGAKLAYVEQGEGPLLILLHGAASDHRAFGQHIEKLSRYFRVVAYDQRYFGNAAWDASWPPMSTELQAKDLVSLIEALGDEPAHLVGWSMGSRLAHHTLLKYPNKVKSAYLFEGAEPIVLSERSGEEERAEMGPLVSPIIERIKANDLAGASEELLAAVSGDKEYLSRQSSETRAMYADNQRATAKYLMAKQPPRKTCEVLFRNERPVMLVIGSKSTVAFMYKRHYDRCLGPRSKVLRVEGATHMWPSESADAFVDSVRSFVLQSN